MADRFCVPLAEALPVVASNYDEVLLSEAQMRAAAGLLAQLKPAAEGGGSLVATQISTRDYELLLATRASLLACIEETRVVVAKRNERRAMAAGR